MFKCKQILIVMMILLSIGYLQVAFAQDMEPRIAITDFPYKGAYQFDNGTSAFVDMLTTALVKTRRFKLVERDRIQDALKEMTLGEAGIVDPSDSQRFGTLTKADFILLGSITEAALDKKIVKVGDVATAKQIFRMSVDIRIIDAKTGDLKTAETVTKSTSKANAVSVGDVVSSSDNTEGIVSDCLRLVANDVIREMVTAIYPITITALSGSQVQLDYGKPVVSEGESYKVIGEDGFEIGLIRVTDVDNRSATGEIIEGENRIQVGSTCRLTKSIKSSVKKKAIPW